MAVNSTEYKKIYNTNGTTGPFAITFPVRLDSGGDADDIKVYYRTAAGVESDITSACTIEGLNVTLGTAYAAGGKIALVREPELKQLSVYSYGTRFPASQFESDLDYAMFCAQKVESETARALRVPITDAAANLDIPNEEDRKGKFLYFNVDTGLPEAAAGAASVPVSAFMATVVDDADAGAALTTLGVTDYAQTILDDDDAETARGTLDVYSKTEITTNHYTKTEIDAAVNPTQITADQIGPKTGTADNDLIQLTKDAVTINGVVIAGSGVRQIDPAVSKTDRFVFGNPYILANHSTENTLMGTGANYVFESGYRYFFKYTGYYTVDANTTGSRWTVRFTTPGNITYLCYTSEYTLTDTTTTRNANLIAHELPASCNATSSATINKVVIEGIVVVSDSTNMAVMFASEVAGDNKVTSRGGLLEIFRVEYIG